MATATSRSRQQTSHRPTQQSSGWPFSATQTLIVGGVAVMTLLGCILLVVAFGGKGTRPATSQLPATQTNPLLVASPVIVPPPTKQPLPKGFDAQDWHKTALWLEKMSQKKPKTPDDFLSERKLFSGCEGVAVDWIFPARQAQGGGLQVNIDRGGGVTDRASLNLYNVPAAGHLIGITEYIKSDSFYDDLHRNPATTHQKLLEARVTGKVKSIRWNWGYCYIVTIHRHQVHVSLK